MSVRPHSGWAPKKAYMSQIRSSRKSRGNRKNLPTNFESLALAPSLARGVAEAGFVTPRPIQAMTIPAAREGRDVLGLAQTGTGKTAAFALPILERLLLPRAGGRRMTRALVLAPTRELAMQIESDIRMLAAFMRVSTACVYGGVGAAPQIQRLRKRPDILIACPGRFLDLYDRGEIDVSGVETLVLDEADHMFDSGFLPDVKRIIDALPDRRQNLMFSATMPDPIRRLADRILDHPHVAEIEHERSAATIEHAFFQVGHDRKTDLLKHLLEQDDCSSAIVFTRTKHRARRLAMQLSRLGHEAVALQGNMSQAQRDRAMNGFRSQRFEVLVATDIAARGIDVASVSHVINYDVPNTADAYTHRVGRTGRAERSGKAYTFISADDGEQVRAIEKRHGSSIRGLEVGGLTSACAERPARSTERRENGTTDGPPARRRRRQRPEAGGRHRGRRRASAQAQ